MKLFRWFRTHKKLTATVVNVIAQVVPIPGMTQEQRLIIGGAIAAYVIGQGQADTGKEAAKIAAASPPVVHLELER